LLLSSSEGAQRGRDDGSDHSGVTVQMRDSGLGGVLEATLRIGAVPVIETDNQGICVVIQNSHSFIHSYLLCTCQMTR